MTAARAIAIVAVALYAAAVIPQLTRPLMYDDANFALAAQAVATTGLPYGNQGWMSDRGDFSHREQWALWHPPLYIYIDGLFARIGGWTPGVLRLPALLGGIATALLTWLIARDFTRGPRVVKEAAAAAAVALTLLCPLAIQSTLVVDIDFSLLLPLSLLFLRLYARWEETPRRWLWLMPLFAVMLWAKMTNPLPLLAVTVAWQLLRGKPKRAALHLGVIGVGGIALAGIVWVGVGTLLGFPLDMPFGVNAVQWQDSSDVARRAYASPGAFIEGLQPTVLWIGPGLVALGMLGIGVRFAQLARRWHFAKIDLLIGFAILLVLGYVNKSAGWFPKYQVALVPLLACTGAPVAAWLWCERPRFALRTGGLAVVASALVTLGLVRDQWAMEQTWAISPTAATLFLALVVIAALAGLVWRTPAAAAVWAALGVALGWSVAISGWQVQAPYQTDYWYGTTGTRDAAAWVDAHLQPNQTYVAAKEVAIASTDLRYVDQDNLVYSLDLGRPLGTTWAGEPLAALVTWQREPYIAGLFERALPDSGYHEEARFGDYVIYVPGS